MGDDPKTKTGCDGAPEEERQNRRQFFNGLGKWSLAIIAAVTALRDGVFNAGDSIDSRFGTSSEISGDPHKKIAKRQKPTHFDEVDKHLNVHTHHAFHCNGPFRDKGCGGGGSPS